MKGFTHSIRTGNRSAAVQRNDDHPDASHGDHGKHDEQHDAHESYDDGA